MICCLRVIFIASLFFSMSISICHADTGNILIFSSFSMPKNSIKGWMKEGEKIHAPIVIRGLVNNSFKETIQKIGELTQDNQGGVQLDPTLFQRYKIDKVPAVVVTNGANCLPNQSCKEEYDVVYGDVTLAYALKKIADQNDQVSPIAETALIELRKNHEA